MKRCWLVSVVKLTFLVAFVATLSPAQIPPSPSPSTFNAGHAGYVFGAVRTCFDHVLSKFSAFSWERILILKSAYLNMVMQMHAQIGDTRKVFFMNPPWSVDDFKKLHFA